MVPTMKSQGPDNCFGFPSGLATAWLGGPRHGSNEALQMVAQATVRDLARRAA